jgi:LmbE family N-acetylglucosaminyl deacetylase
MTPELATFLARHTPGRAGMVVWENGCLPLRIAGYLSDALPPLDYVTSVRSLVFQDGALLVLRNRDGMHVLPGGRREAGETLEHTLAREVLEATATLGIPAEALTVHDFEVRTFPERRQDILELLIALWEEWRPDVVLQPSVNDIHQDHQVVAAEGLRAFKRTTVLGYEIPWNNLNFNFQAYVGLERAHVERKVAALACYASQQHRNYADAEYMWSRARTHGVNVGREYAEVFEVYRVIA